MSQHNKQNKYNYLQHSFQKQLQRSYDRNNRQTPPSVNSSSIRSPAKFRSPPRSSQFSPYQNKQENIKDKILVQELKNHNKILSQQIQQYKSMIDKLHAQLRLRVDQFTSLDILRKKQKMLHQQKIAQMKQQIGILLTKNTFLEERNILLEKQLKKVQIQITRNQARTRSLSVAATSKHNSDKLIQQITSLLDSGPKQKKRDNGKLLNQTFSNLQSAIQSPKNPSKQLPTQPSQLLQHIQSLVRKVQKYQQLTNSILEMHQKITGKKMAHDHLQLKHIWKWLKQLGHNYNIIQKWKKMLIDVLGLVRKRGEQLSIDDVLQKAVVELHSAMQARK